MSSKKGLGICSILSGEAFGLYQISTNLAVGVFIVALSAVVMVYPQILGVDANGNDDRQKKK